MHGDTPMKVSTKKCSISLIIWKKIISKIINYKSFMYKKKLQDCFQKLLAEGLSTPVEKRSTSLFRGQKTPRFIGAFKALKSILSFSKLLKDS